jgi:hypothetical protein
VADLQSAALATWLRSHVRHWRSRFSELFQGGQYESSGRGLQNRVQGPQVVVLIAQVMVLGNGTYWSMDAEPVPLFPLP